MQWDLFIKGLLAGILVSIPVGPMSILVIQRTANKDLRSGFYSGLGVAFTDTLWALVAGFSVTYVINFLREYQSILQIVAGIVVFLLGFYIFRSHPLKTIRKHREKGTSPIECFSTTALISLSNPAVVLAYIAIFASANIVFNVHQIGTPIIFIVGFIIGTTGWWTTLTTTINRFRHHFDIRKLWWFNKVSGASVMLFVVISTLLVLLKGNPVI